MGALASQHGFYGDPDGATGGERHPASATTMGGRVTSWGDTREVRGKHVKGRTVRLVIASGMSQGLAPQPTEAFTWGWHPRQVTVSCCSLTVVASNRTVSLTLTITLSLTPTLTVTEPCCSLFVADSEEQFMFHVLAESETVGGQC